MAKLGIFEGLVQDSATTANGQLRNGSAASSQAASGWDGARRLGTRCLPPAAVSPKHHCNRLATGISGLVTGVA